MNESKLIQLLRAADVSPPTGRAQLAERVRRRAANEQARRQSRLALSGLAAAIAVAALLTPSVSQIRQDTPRVVAAPEARPALSVDDITRLRAEIAQIDAELARLRDSELPRVSAETIVANAIARARVEVALETRRSTDAAARTLVEKGDRLCFEYRECEAAAAVWRDVQQLFPGTAWATLADRRLTERHGV
ncbi:MAG: hypothetical protein KDA32_14600 [Phycisphaerales bacterium]|nr:hypothetical protein [Phycisphaerales bacterium]